ncbi:hypothetical protein ACKI16_47365, partial [Streptomyces scabiei]|uniref:hypothetical protein n=1 Tax=Streptomyces scabiei TaxID=1930 RepID=UPI0038F66C4A
MATRSTSGKPIASAQNPLAHQFVQRQCVWPHHRAMVIEPKPVHASTRINGLPAHPIFVPSLFG